VFEEEVIAKNSACVLEGISRSRTETVREEHWDGLAILSTVSDKTL